jgi:hypothetical protein
LIRSEQLQAQKPVSRGVSHQIASSTHVDSLKAASSLKITKLPEKKVLPHPIAVEPSDEYIAETRKASSAFTTNPIPSSLKVRKLSSTS